MCALLCLALIQSGCVIACGPLRCPPPQKLRVVAPSPSSYTILVVDDILDEHFDTSVGADGRVEFDVPVYSRHCTQYLFGAIKIHSPTPVEKRRAIRVMKDGSVVRRLSAADIADLPVDGDGYHVLSLEK